MRTRLPVELEQHRRNPVWQHHRTYRLCEVATLVSMMFGGSNAYGGLPHQPAEISSAIWDITTGGRHLGPGRKGESLVDA